MVLLDLDLPIRWGVLGTGRIAGVFVDELRALTNHHVAAVASRSPQRAACFAQQHGVATTLDSYEALCASNDIDVVYVATVHTEHAVNALMAIDAGKAVLVEKPFTVNAAEACRVANVAAERGVFVMEAMWTRFLPHIAHMRRGIENGVIGEPRLLMSDHCLRLPPDPTDRVFDWALAGGALLDVGIYPISIASMVMGTPTAVSATSTFLQTGVDGSTSAMLKFPAAQDALVSASIEYTGLNRLSIIGDAGRISCDTVWDTASPLVYTLTTDEGATTRYAVPHKGAGLRHQADEVAHCLRRGRTYSDVMPLTETVTIMQTMDQVRRCIGLQYPGES